MFLTIGKAVKRMDIFMRLQTIFSFPKMLRKSLPWVTFLTCLTLMVNLSVAAPAIIPRPPEIAATSYILIDAVTGEIIVEENADEALPPASLTKIMTAYIAVEEIMNGNLSLSDQVHISEKAWRMEGSKMFVGVNSQVSVEDLLRGIIIQSGNDASVAIAEHIAGSEDAFADMMNQYSEVLGMSNSFFMNSSGLDTEVYYNTMSARDLSILAQATISRHADYYPIYAEREFTYNDIRQTNRNSLLFRDRNVDGMKTNPWEPTGTTGPTGPTRPVRPTDRPTDQIRGGRTGATSAEQRLPIKDHGPCFGTNGHPRRDTDVILRLSKSTIEDLPF